MTPPSTFPRRAAARIDRRSFLAAAGAALPAVWLAACGGDDSSTGTTTGTQPAGTVGDTAEANIVAADMPPGASIVGRFPPQSLVPGSVRLPISLEVGGALLTNGPAALDAAILDDGGNVLADGLRAEVVQHEPAHAQFWIARADIAAPGIYGLRIGGIDEPKQFQVLDRGVVAQPKPGDPLPPFDTPTLADARGVQPICTRAAGVCDLHTMTLTEALQLGKPIVYLIGTPAFCQFDVCGPMLDLLLDAHTELGDRVTMVHADVYTDDTATTATPAVDAYRLSWEPSLFVADATGTIVDRLDITYSASELRAVLTRAGA